MMVAVFLTAEINRLQTDTKFNREEKLQRKEALLIPI